ncbi:MAG: hypothetical protein GF344_09635 [Chitinivibrionales bacterium]|nr:hypothetical protein [Chitinivibrionales bacterium]MBD3357103.1 hypothetical protein [Chitinivibrionales bacterium]
MADNKNGFEQHLREIMKAEDPNHPVSPPAGAAREDHEQPGKAVVEKRKAPRWVEWTVRITAAAVAVLLLLLFALRIAFR